MNEPWQNWILGELDRFERTGLRRHLRRCENTGAWVTRGARRLLNLASNDYLGLANHPRVIAAAQEALRRYGAGATASRHVCGHLPIHADLERRLAEFKRTEAAVVYSSGYATNVGLLTSLCSPGDLVVVDRLAHASLLDGVRLSGATWHRFRHNDPDHADRLLRQPARRRCIVTESVFSMDGDLAPLEELLRLAREHGAALIVDEAHATGVYGSGGVGRSCELNADGGLLIPMGTLSKALASQGGFVAGPGWLRDWLVQTSRSLIYSTGLHPAAAGAALGALEILREEPGRGARLRERARQFRRQLRSAGLPVEDSDSPIVPLVVGDNTRACTLAAALEHEGLLVVAIRPPSVPPQTARLRVSLSLNLSDEEVAHAADTIIRVWTRNE